MPKVKRERGEPRDIRRQPMSLGPLFEMDSPPVHEDSLEQTVVMDMVDETASKPDAVHASSVQRTEDLPLMANEPAVSGMSTEPSGDIARPVSNTGLHSRFFDSLFRI